MREDGLRLVCASDRDLQRGQSSAAPFGIEPKQVISRSTIDRATGEEFQKRLWSDVPFTLTMAQRRLDHVRDVVMVVKVHGPSRFSTASWADATSDDDEINTT